MYIILNWEREERGEMVPVGGGAQKGQTESNQWRGEESSHIHHDIIVSFFSFFSFYLCLCVQILRTHGAVQPSAFSLVEPGRRLVCGGGSSCSKRARRFTLFYPIRATVRHGYIYMRLWDGDAHAAILNINYIHPPSFTLFCVLSMLSVLPLPLPLPCLSSAHWEVRWT